MRTNDRFPRGKIQPKEYIKHEIALNPISTSKVEDLAMELKKDYTIVMVTHNMQQAVHVSDKRTEDYMTGRFGSL